MTDELLAFLIPDDDPDLLSIVSDYVRYCGHMVWTACDGQQALLLATQHDIDAALLDVVMPGLSGIDLIPRLQELQPGITILLMTAYGSIEQAVDAMKLGTLDYLEKPVTLPRVRELTERVVQQKRQQKRIWEMLSDREREVLLLLAEGKSDVEIAQALNLSKYTVSTHVRNILTKLSVENRVQAAVRWDRWMRGKER
jgi:DNA-binding NarL/FixJ family response regulator